MADRDELRRKIAAAQTGDELAAAVAALDSHDQGMNSRAAQDRELDLAARTASRALAPVPLFEHHTAATDWLDDMAEPSGDYRTAMIAEASTWYRGLDPAVQGDGEELGEQARGRARSLASAYGSKMRDAEREFLTYVGYLAKTAGSGLPQIDQTVDANNKPSATPYPTEVFDNFAPQQNDYNGGVEGENHDSQTPSTQAPMIQQIMQQDSSGSGFGSGAELEDHHDTTFNPGMGYAEVPLGVPGTIPTAPGAAPAAQSAPNPNESADDYDEGSERRTAAYTPADPHGYRWVTGSREVLHPFHEKCGSSHWPGEGCGHEAHTASVAIGYTGSLDDFRKLARCEQIGAEAGLKAVHASAGPRALAEHYNTVMAGFSAADGSAEDTAVLHGFMAVVRPVLAAPQGGSGSRLDFKDAASSLPQIQQTVDSATNAPTPDADQLPQDVMFPIDPAFAEQWVTGPAGPQPRGNAKAAASMTPPPGAAHMFGRMDALEGKAPPHKDSYPFSKIQHGNYLRGWNEVTAPVHAMNGRQPVTRDEYATQTGRADLHDHYMGAYASAWSKLNPASDNPHWEHLPDSARNPKQGSSDSGTGTSSDTDYCPSCGHRPGCDCPEDCDKKRRDEARKQARHALLGARRKMAHEARRVMADTLSQPHQTTDDQAPPFNSPATTPQPAGGDFQAGMDAGVADARAGEHPTFADNSSEVSPYVKGYAKGYGQERQPLPQPDVPGSMGGDSGQAVNAQEAQQAFQVARSAGKHGESCQECGATTGPGRDLRHKDDCSKAEDWAYEAALRVTSRDFSPAERASAEKKGDALPGGKLPIENASDLHNAEELEGKVKGVPKSEVDSYMKGKEKEYGHTGTRVSAAFVPDRARANADFQRAYKYAVRWRPGQKLVAQGSAPFEAGLYAGITDNPRAQGAWTSAHRVLAGSHPELASRVTAHRAFTAKLATRDDKVVTRGLYVQAATTVDLVTDGPGTSPDPMGSTPINGPGTPPPSGGRGDPARSGGAPPYQGTAPLPGGPVVSDDVMGKPQEPEQPNGPLPQGFSGPGPGYGNQNLAPRAPNTADGAGYENQGAYEGDPERYKTAAFRNTVQANLQRMREGK